jgi:hypothetical protein
MADRVFRRGEPVIYRKSKCTASPGPRARNVQPARRGENYAYCVDKFWLVVEQRDNVVLVLTRRGKKHIVQRDDPNLRRPSLWERLRFGPRFPSGSVLASKS